MKSRNIAVIVLTLLMFLSGYSAKIFAEAQTISKSDRSEIINLLNKLASSIIDKDISAMSALISPNIDGELRREIIELYEERFSKYSYKKYEFSPPTSKKIKIVVPGSKVRVKTSYSSIYESGGSGSGSTNGMPANFTLEKLDGEWLILDSDFYTLKRFIKFIIIVGLSVFALMAVTSIFWGWMLVDCVKREFPKDSDRTTWILILIFANVFGALVYYKMIKKKQVQYEYTKP